MSEHCQARQNRRPKSGRPKRRNPNRPEPEVTPQVTDHLSLRLGHLGHLGHLALPRHGPRMLRIAAFKAAHAAVTCRDPARPKVGLDLSAPLAPKRSQKGYETMLASSRPRSGIVTQVSQVPRTFPTWVQLKSSKPSLILTEHRTDQASICI